MLNLLITKNFQQQKHNNIVRYSQFSIQLKYLGSNIVLCLHYTQVIYRHVKEGSL